jgi:hypothetical protein
VPVTDTVTPESKNYHFGFVDNQIRYFVLPEFCT